MGKQDQYKINQSTLEKEKKHNERLRMFQRDICTQVGKTVELAKIDAMCISCLEAFLQDSGGTITDEEVEKMVKERDQIRKPSRKQRNIDKRMGL